MQRSARKTTKCLRPDATLKDLFIGGFIFFLLLFAVAFAFCNAFGHSNVIWNGVELHGWPLLGVNCVAIPVVAALMGGCFTVERVLTRKFRKRRQSRTNA